MKYSWVGMLVALFVFFFPFLISREIFYGAINVKILWIACLVDVLLLWGAYRLWKTKEVALSRRSLVALCAVAILGVFYLSAYFGVYPGLSLWSDLSRSTGVFFLSHLLALAFLLSAYLTDKDWSLMRRSMVISAAVFSFFTILGNEGLHISGYVFWLNLDFPGLTFANSTFAGAYLLLAFAFGLIELARVSKESKWRLVIIGSLILTALSPMLFNVGVFLGKTPFLNVLQNPALLIGSARASSAVLFALLLFVGGWWSMRRYLSPSVGRRGVFVWSTLWILGLAGILSFLFIPGSFVQQAYIKESSAARVYVWEGAWQAFTERPFLGWGPETFDHAFEQHFDNRLYLAENFSEIWFDRAHNVILDTFVSVGIIGTLLLLILVSLCFRVIFLSQKKGIMGEWEAVLLVVMVVAHFLQLQTAFDTVGTYVLLAFFLGYILFLERQLSISPVILSKKVSYVLALLLVFLALVSLKCFVYDEWARQHALHRTFVTTDDARQLAYVKESLVRTPSFETLRLSSASLMKGGLQKIAESKKDPAVVTAVKKRLDVYDEAYARYLLQDPESYRARMNYAYLLLVKTGLGEDRRDDARSIIEDSYRLSPGNPITPVLHMLVFLYSGDLEKAKEKVAEATALNPDITFTLHIREYLDRQVEQFPNVSLLKLENL